jgi:MutS domain V
VTVPELLLQYEGKLRELQAGLAQTRAHNTVTAALLAMIIAVFLMLSLYAIRQRASFFWPSLPVPFAVVSARRLRLRQHSQYQMRRLQKFYRRAVERVKGNWAQNGADGEEFNSSTHVYARDLNIFGEGSLFQLLCTARTANGQRGLAEYLRTAPSLEETLLRQQAVRELRERLDLREQVALLGKFDFSESKWETFEEWLNSRPFLFSRVVQVTALFTSALLSAIVLASLVGLIPWIQVPVWIGPLVAFHAVVGLYFHERVKQMLGWLHPVSLETNVLREGMRLLEASEFKSEKLRQLANRARGSAKSVRRLERLLNALHERNKDLFYVPSLILLFGTQLCMAIEDWRIAHRADLRIWLDVWAEFEALNALANYAYENPESVFPEFSDAEVKFEAEALGHPLLSYESCVRNDVQLDRESRFYVISGSNMSGKSTLLRTIGLNAVLAMAGAPVRARVLRLSRLSICASLSIVDSLAEGKSKFLAEVERLRQTLDTAAESVPVLFLIDEILSGTNSRDRRIAAEGVTRTLVNRGALGAISTHDLALTEIAALEELHGVNVHMGSRDGGGPMDFDYLVKPGVTNESNALAIARLAGVPV